MLCTMQYCIGPGNVVKSPDIAISLYCRFTELQLTVRILYVLVLSSFNSTVTNFKCGLNKTIAIAYAGSDWVCALYIHLC